VSVCGSKPLQWNYHLSEEGTLQPSSAGRVDRRQDAQPFVCPNGALYVSASETFLKADSFFLPDTVGFEMNRIDSLDIDDLTDFQIASAIVDQGLRAID
jgi:CMP-N-acetylneuraminic acid synthetase